MRRLLTIIAFSGGFLTHAWATEYFVSTAGNDNNNGLSTNAPFLTIQYAANQLGQGDTLNIRGGQCAI